MRFLATRFLFDRFNSSPLTTQPHLDLSPKLTFTIMKTGCPRIAAKQQIKDCKMQAKKKIIKNVSTAAPTSNVTNLTMTSNLMHKNSGSNRFATLEQAKSMITTCDGKPIKRSVFSLLSEADLAGFFRNYSQQISSPDSPFSGPGVIFSPAFAALSQITDRLYLTSFGGLTKEKFARLDRPVTCIIHVTHDLVMIKPRRATAYRVPLQDLVTEDALMYFHDVADKIEENSLTTAGCTVVHCKAGVSRSATMVLAYLIKHKKLTLREAFGRVYRVRSVIDPNYAFMAQLMTFERLVHGSCRSAMCKFAYNDRWIRIPDFYRTDFPALYQTQRRHQAGES